MTISPADSVAPLAFRLCKNLWLPPGINDSNIPMRADPISSGRKSELQAQRETDDQFERPEEIQHECSTRHHEGTQPD
jgi:hypothetical protein